MQETNMACLCQEEPCNLVYIAHVTYLVTLSADLQITLSLTLTFCDKLMLVLHKVTMVNFSMSALTICSEIFALLIFIYYVLFIFLNKKNQ